MNLRSPAGFEEIPHTADWAMSVWAVDLPGLFIEAARGMNALSGVQSGKGPRTRQTFTADAPDPESLLVAFLSELIYTVEQERLVFDEFAIQIQSLTSPKRLHLQVGMSGAPLIMLSKAIKAVTYHNLQIRPTDAGYETEIVFDV